MILCFFHCSLRQQKPSFFILMKRASYIFSFSVFVGNWNEIWFRRRTIPLCMHASNTYRLQYVAFNINSIYTQKSQCFVFHVCLYIKKHGFGRRAYTATRQTHYYRRRTAAHVVYTLVYPAISHSPHSVRIKNRHDHIFNMNFFNNNNNKQRCHCIGVLLSVGYCVSIYASSSTSRKRDTPVYSCMRLYKV